MAVEDRLERIEEKLDDLTDAMVSLARSEEKILAIQEQVQNQNERLNRHSEKIDDVEKVAIRNEFTSKIVWAILIAIIGSLVSMIMGVM